jgi:hypothetical protein
VRRPALPLLGSAGLRAFADPPWTGPGYSLGAIQVTLVRQEIETSSLVFGTDLSLVELDAEARAQAVTNT